MDIWRLVFYHEDSDCISRGQYYQKVEGVVTRKRWKTNLVFPETFPFVFCIYLNADTICWKLK